MVILIDVAGERGDERGVDLLGGGVVVVGTVEKREEEVPGKLKEGGSEIML